MSAGTVGFTDTRKDTNHIGSVISRILEARKLAEDEREYAESIAEKNQTSLEEAGIGRGYFFKKALAWKFGGEYKQKKISQIKTWKSRGSLLRSAIVGRSGKNKLNKFERAQAVFDMFKSGDKPATFRDKFKPLYQGFVDDPMTRPMSHLVKPGAAKKTQKALSKRKRVSKEDILDSLGAVTESIQKIAESISEKNRVVADQMIHSSTLQGMMYQQLKGNATSLDDKLQKIINALSNQTQVQKNAIDKVESKQTEARLERQKDAASIVNFDDLSTKVNESKLPATSTQDVEFQQMAAYEQNDIPKAETGAIFSGPDSGYLAELHGDEVVIPINNNYTQGEPSAVDGKVRKMPKYERGTSNLLNELPTYQPKNNYTTNVSTAPISSKFGFNAMNNIIGTAGGGTTEASKMTQSMVDVMSLPMMAAGGTILSATTKYMERLGGEAADVIPEIERIARPVANVFGLPQSVVNATKMSLLRKKAIDSQQEKNGEDNKNIFSKLIDGFGKLLEKLGSTINGPGPQPTDSRSNQLIPGNAPPEIKALMESISGGEGGPNSVQGIGEVAGLSDMTIDQAILTAKSYIGKGSTTGALGAYQFHSSYLRERAVAAGLDPSKDKFSIENQTQIMRNFMTQVYTAGGGQGGEAGMLKALKEGKIESEIFPKLSKDLGWPSLPGGSQQNVHTPHAKSRYESALIKYQQLQSQASNTSISTSNLGQAITNNYGLSVGQERQFTHPQYGVIKAHKTSVGFEFFGAGLNNKLDMSPSNPQSKSIVDYFIQTNGGRTNPQITPPQSSRQQIEQKVSSLSTSTSSTKFSTGSGITILNTRTANQKITSAGSSSPPSEDSSSVESGLNPTQDFYNNPFSIGVG